MSTRFPWFNLPKSKKASRRPAVRLELLEDRCVPTTVQLFPGSDHQTNNPYKAGAFTSIIHGGFLTVGRDIQGNIIDFNKDGTPDLLALTAEYITESQKDPLEAARQALPLLGVAGSARFIQTQVYSSANRSSPYTLSSSGLAVIDWNQDGFQDFINVKYESNASVTYTLYGNDGTGVFRPTQSQTLMQSTATHFEANQIALADFNSDGAPDIIVPTGINRGEFTIFQGELVSGKWTGLFNLATPNVIQAGSPTNISSIYILPITTDLNGDGKLDIAVFGSGNNANLFINDGSGKFSLTPNLLLPTINNLPAYNIASGDLNKDGKMDLVLSTNSRSFSPTTLITGPMTVYLNQTPSGSSGIPIFGAGYAVGGSDTHYSNMTLGDMNLDGNLDLVVSQQGYDGILFNVLEGDGKGQFVRNQEFEGYRKSNSTQSGIALADWNSDGQLDVALVSGWDQSHLPNDQDVTQSVGVSINGTFTAPGVSPATLPAAVLGQPYSFQLVPTGGNSSLSYNISVDPVSNSLPSGLTVSPTGLISGTPTKDGPFQVQFHVVQPNGLRGNSANYLQVNNSTPGVVTISPATLPNGYLNTAYSQQLTQSGGTGSIAWAISAGALPSGLTLSPTGLISGQPTATSVSSFTVSATDSLGNIGYRQYTLTVSTNPLPPLGTPNIVGASATGLGLVTVFNADGTPRTSFHPYGTTYQGGVTVAQGDVDGDGTNDLITGTTFGATPHVKVFNGKTLAVMQSFFAYAQSFTGGVSVAAGDVNADGKADIITGAGPGGGPHVEVFSGTNAQLIDSFFAYDPNFKGGVHVAAGDLNADGHADIITGAGPTGGSHVKAFSGADQSTLLSFMAYNTQFTGGVTVAAGDVNGDGKADIITGPGFGGGPNVKVFNGQNGSQLASFFAFDQSNTGGVNVSAADLNNDGKADIIAALASKGAQVSTFDAVTLALIESFEAFNQPVGVSVSGK